MGTCGEDEIENSLDSSLRTALFILRRNDFLAAVLNCSHDSGSSNLHVGSTER